MTRTVIVTGAARGIGLTTTAQFVDQGWQVAMIDRDEDALADAAEGRDGVRAFTCDVSDPDAVNGMMQAVIAWAGRLDALVNNAGVADFGPIEQTSFERWRTVMATNLDGVFLCSQAAIPHLKARAGSIVNVASISGLRASTLRVAYGTSKAADDHPLLQHLKRPNFILTPHVGWSSQGARQALWDQLIGHIDNFASGAPSNNVCKP